MLYAGLQFKKEDLGQASTSHYPSVAHPVLHRNNGKRKRTEQQQRETKESS